MVFIRRVRTASGATAVQIAESVGGRRQRIVAHVGSAHTEAELGVLMERARGLLADERQGVLDLGIEVLTPKARLVGPPRESALFTEPSQGPSSRVGVGAGRVVATGSQVLFDALAAVFTSLGFDGLQDQVFRDVVLARVVEPTSLRDAGRVLEDLGQHPVSYPTRKRMLVRCQERRYRDLLAGWCFTHAVRSGDVSLVMYDVTTLYFEAEKEDDLRKVGFSKERRVDPQIVVGLLVDRAGFPLEVGCFEGNLAEKHTIIPIIRQFQERHQIENMVVVADAGMMSAQILTDLDEAGFRFIVGSRLTKAPIDLASHFHWNGNAFTDGQIIDTLTPKKGTNRDNDQAKRAEPVWDPDLHPGSWRAIWAFSRTRYLRDNKTLTAQENRARDVIAGVKAARTPRFVKTTRDGASLDEAALDRARMLAGLKGYVTNLPVDLMGPAEVLASYHDLWHVEQSFRMSKTDLAARPMFHYKRDPIEAHMTTVFAALAVSREAQARTGLAIGNILKQLRPLRTATIEINGTRQAIPPAIRPAQQAILNALTRQTHALSK